METTKRQASGGACDPAPSLCPDTDAYLARLSLEQQRYLGGLTDAATLIDPSSPQVARMAAIQNRLTQEFLDGQRSILRRRAQTEANVARIGAAAVADARRIVGQAATPVLLPAPTGVPIGSVSRARPNSTMTDLPTGAPVSSLAPIDLATLAELIDGAFEPSEPDGAVMRRQLRDVLDEWWRAENHESKAAIDDANARAAMELHTAKIDASTLARAASVREEFVEPRISYEAPRHLSPLVDALETTTHKDLDGLLARLLDTLDAPIELGTMVAAPQPPAVATLPPPSAAFRFPEPPRQLAPNGPFVPTLPPRVETSATDPSDGPPSEAFDRFWGTRTARVSGGRDWVFMQVLLPAVTVIAVLALVLAIVG